MKRLVLGLIAVLFIGLTASAANSKYDLNDVAVETAFEQATELTTMCVNTEEFNVLGQAYGDMQIKGSKNGAVAFLLSWFLGSLAVHRMYLGAAVGVYVGYILTCGGLGIVAWIDTIMLFIDLITGGDKLDDYTDNPAFFMW